MKYSAIHIIYNPNSTGNSEAMARELQKQLSEKIKNVNIELIATKTRWSRGGACPNSGEKRKNTIDYFLPVATVAITNW